MDSISLNQFNNQTDVLIQQNCSVSVLEDLKCFKQFTEKIIGDGHCGFRSIAVHIYQDQEKYNEIRSLFVKEVEKISSNTIDLDLKYSLDYLIETAKPLKPNEFISQEKWMEVAMLSLFAEIFQRPIVFLNICSDVESRNSCTFLPDCEPSKTFDPIGLLFSGPG